MTNLIEKDLVVLKHNDRKDANVSEDNCLYDLYLTESKDLYFYRSDKNKWTLSNLNGDDDYYKSLKPIEKSMKEYLRKNSNGTHSYIGTVRPEHVVDFMIEIPEGSNFAAYSSRLDEYYFNSDDVFSPEYLIWQRNNNQTIASAVESVNDQVASAETARQSEKVLKEILGGDLPEFEFEAIDAFIESNVEQGQKHSHYKKDVSHLNVIDIYRVTEMFKPHSCGAHIAKKALCSGQRGHKDLLTDIQDIIDTAERWKEMLIEDENSCKD